MIVQINKHLLFSRRNLFRVRIIMLLNDSLISFSDIIEAISRIKRFVQLKQVVYDCWCWQMKISAIRIRRKWNKRCLFFYFFSWKNCHPRDRRLLVVSRINIFHNEVVYVQLTGGHSFFPGNVRQRTVEYSGDY